MFSDLGITVVILKIGEDISLVSDAAGGHLLYSDRAAAVGVQFKVKPELSNW